jgi:hypothetical protein
MILCMVQNNQSLARAPIPRQILLPDLLDHAKDPSRLPPLLVPGRPTRPLLARHLGGALPRGR